MPAPIVARVASAAGLAGVVDELASYDGTSYRTRLMTLVRAFVGVAGYDRAAWAVAVQASLAAARTRDDLADIVNAAIEDLVRRRYELPAFGTLLKIARTARAFVNRGYFRRIAAAISPEERGRLNALLAVPEGTARSPWDQVKAEPRGQARNACAGSSCICAGCGPKRSMGRLRACPTRRCGVVRGSASQAATAAFVNQTVKLPRWRKAASYSAQFATLCFCLGMRWRRSWFSLNGTVEILGHKRGRPPRPAISERQPPDPCNKLTRGAAGCHDRAGLVARRCTL